MILNFYLIIMNFLEKFLKEGKDRLRTMFVMLEKDFHKTVDKNEWHVKDWKTRRLWTPLGDVIIRRRLYESNPKTGLNKQKILFDKHIGLVPYLYIQPCFFFMFLKSASKANSYKSFSRLFGYQFSTSMVSNILKKTNVYLKPKKLRDKTPKLFLNLDDIFVKQHKGKKYCKRIALAYTGSRLTGKKNRFQLVEKTIICINTDLSRQEQADELERTLITIYGEIGEIIIVGDGAQWITTIANNFLTIKTKRYIDKFHYSKYIKDLVGKYNKIDWEYFRSIGNKDEAAEYLLKKIADKDGIIKNPESVKEKVAKIKKFYNSYVKCTKLGYINAVEGVQSHVVANPLKLRRHFSKEIGAKILAFKIARYNGWETTNNKDEGIKLKDLGKIDVKIDSLTSYSFSNVPILDSGNKETVHIFNTLIHGQ